MEYTLPDSFVIDLAGEVLKNTHNYHTDNYDKDRFGRLPLHRSLCDAAKQRLLPFLEKIGFSFIDNIFKYDFYRIEELKPYFSKINYLYSRLEDQESKNLLLKIIAYRILGNKRVKLPVNTSDFWKKRKKIDSLKKSNQVMPVEFMDWKLSHFDLKNIGYNIELFHIPAGIFVEFVLRQYEYLNTDTACKVEEGDYVIDAGGCWGDTALYFAHESGPDGRVFSFEFIPDNLKVFRKNLELNPDLKKRIEIIENPVWSASGQALSFNNNGPGSRMSGNQDGINVLTIGIDDFANNIQKIDFIKMDIEGAELEALKGAEGTIRKYKPKLAIAIYHDIEHFYSIPEYLDSLNLDYRFFLGHHTIHLEETVLYAVPDKKLT